MRNFQRVDALLAALLLIGLLGWVMPAAAQGTDPVTVSIANFAYAPAKLTITAGQTVRFTNQDDVAHTVTADAGGFDSGSIDKDKSWSYTFKKTGTFNYYCTVHPSMKGTIIVTSP